MTGFFYAPSTVPHFFRLDAAGGALDQDGRPVPVDAPYEVRLFDADHRDAPAVAVPPAADVPLVARGQARPHGRHPTPWRGPSNS